MAGTTLTLQQPTKRKRDYDLTEEIEVERDTRYQTCLECTLSWPWVIFHRNEDGSRNLDQRKCYTCLGINDQQWELNVIRMTESISKAKKKLLRIETTGPTSSTSTPISTTPNGGQTPSQFTTAQALAVTLNSNSQSLQYHPNPPMPIPNYNQYHAQPPPLAQPHFHPDHHMYGTQILAPQYQDRFGQALFNPAQAYGYNFDIAQAQSQHHQQQQQQGTIHHQPQPQSANQYQPQHQPQHQPQPQSANQYQSQPYPQQQQPQQQPQILPPAQSHGIWTQLFRQTEPARAMNWVMMNYHPAAGAPPIPQMELYKHYASTIPRQGYPPLLQGKDFILTVAKHYEGMGVRLDKGTFTIGGLWRRNQPVATLR